VSRRSVVALTRILLLPVVAAACGAGGCGMSAQIETRQGQHVEARILGGSPGSIYLAGDQHERFTMRRDEIADVDFPGNVLMIGGVGMTAFGGYRLLTGDTSCAALEQTGTCLASVVPAIAGLLMFGWGLYSYWRSKRAFADRSRAEPDPPMKRTPGEAPPAEHPVWRKPDPFADPAR
jgi:hypothetical protein